MLQLHLIAPELIWAKDPKAKFCCWGKKINTSKNRAHHRVPRKLGPGSQKKIRVKFLSVQPVYLLQGIAQIFQPVPCPMNNIQIRATKRLKAPPGHSSIGACGGAARRGGGCRPDTSARASPRREDLGQAQGDAKTEIVYVDFIRYLGFRRIEHYRTCNLQKWWFIAIMEKWDI